MSRSKFIAATITTLVLFAIVRFFSSTPSTTEDQPVIEDVNEKFEKEEAEFEESLNIKVSKNKKILRIAAKPLQAFEGDEVEIDAASDMKDFFSTKSEYMYFKIKDGLALVGGDVVLGELSEEQQKENKFKGRLLKDKPPKSKLWPSSEVPFGFNEGFPEELKTEVLKAIKYFNGETVMEFVPVDVEHDEDAVVFKFREGAPCSSYLGRVGGFQPVYLRSSCSSQDVIHELMHVLGFVHEQQREERDRHMKVLWENIEETFQYNFSILPDSMVHQYQGSVFNISLESVMMYHDDAFAKKGRRSLKSLSSDKISPISSGLADIDKERLELLYGR